MSESLYHVLHVNAPHNMYFDMSTQTHTCTHTCEKSPMRMKKATMQPSAPNMSRNWNVLKAADKACVRTCCAAAKVT